LVDRDYFEEKSLYNLILKPIFCTFPGRGMIRKAILPFLLGLKLKTTVLVPLALGLIALKTWKAMTLGLLSLVLSGALVIYEKTFQIHAVVISGLVSIGVISASSRR